MIRRQERSYAGCSLRAMLKDISNPRMPRPKTTNTPSSSQEMIKRFLLKAILIERGNRESIFFTLLKCCPVFAFAMSLEGPLHKVINFATIDKNWGERWIILFAKRDHWGIKRNLKGLLLLGIHHHLSISKDHPHVCSLILGRLCNEGIVWLIKPRPTNKLRAERKLLSAKIPFLGHCHLMTINEQPGMTN